MRAAAPVLKDSYGFVVKKEHHELFRQYAPLWDKEELERALLWAGFLRSFLSDGAHGSDAVPESPPLSPSTLALSAEEEAEALAALSASYSEWHAASRDAGGGSAAPDPPEWLPQMRCLVQAGVPKALRGRLWRLFLRLDAKKDAGVYDQLVQKALGKTKYGRRFEKAKAEAHTPVTTDAAHSGAAATAAGSVPRANAPSSAIGNGSVYSPAAAVAAGVPSGQGPEGSADGDAGEGGGSASGQGKRLSISRRSTSDNESNRGIPWHPNNRNWNVQIEKDLHRTFPGHPIMDRSGRFALRRILAAYARRNETVGYCQGMNFIAGALLLFMDEEVVFWALATIVEDLLPGYFAQDLVAAQVDQLVFKHMVDQRFPTLCKHLTRHGVNVSSMALQWFLCMFVNSLPLESCFRVWDVLFFELSSSVLFRCGLALVDIYAQALVATVDSIDAHSLLQSMAPMSYDSSRLIDMACIAFAGLTIEQIAALRKAYNTTVKAEKHQDSSGEDNAWLNSEDEESFSDESAVSEDSIEEAMAGEPGMANGYGESGSDSDDTASPLKAAKRARERSGASAAARALIQQMKAQHKTDAGQAVVEAEEQREAEADQGWHSTPQWPSPIARLRERGDLTPVREGSSVAEEMSSCSPSVLGASQATSMLPSPEPSGTATALPSQPITAGPDSASVSPHQQEQEQDQKQQKDRSPVLANGPLDAGVLEARVDGVIAAHGTAAAREPTSRKLFHGGQQQQRRKRRSHAGSRSTGSRSRSNYEDGDGFMGVSRSSAAAEAAYHIAATPFKTPPRGRLEPGSTPFFPEDGLDIPEDREVEMGPGALRRRVLAAHNAAMEGATAAADGSLQISVASDFADSSMADSSRDVSPNARNSKKRSSWRLAHALALEGISADELPVATAKDRAHRRIVLASSAVARTVDSTLDAIEAALPRPRAKSAEQEEAAEAARHAAAVQQLLGLVEGLEEELFNAEARRHDAEVEAKALAVNEGHLQGELDGAVLALQERAALLDALNAKLTSVGETLDSFEHELQTREMALASLRKELAARDKQLAAKDALITQLTQQQAAAANGQVQDPTRTLATGAFFRSMLRRGVSGALAANDAGSGHASPSAGTPLGRAESGGRANADSPAALDSPVTPQA